MRSAFALRITSGRIILISAMPGSLRAVRHCIFTGGVVEESCICSAGFLRKHPRCGERPNPLRLLTAFASTSPKGRGSGETAHFALELETLRGLPKAPPLGELSSQVTERARLLAERARSVKCASNVSGHAPTGESSVWSGPQAATNAN